jgi:hypothetical protein
MPDVLPQCPASPLKPEVQGVQALRMRCRLPQAMARVLNVLLDLAFFPAAAGLQNSASGM